MEDKKYHFDTKRIHAGYSSEDHFHAVNTPIYQTAAFDLGDIDRARRLWTGSENGGIYTKSYWSATIWKTLRNRAVSCIIRHGIIKKYRVLRHKKREKQDEQHRKCRINPTPSLNPTPYPSPEIPNK